MSTPIKQNCFIESLALFILVSHFHFENMKSHLSFIFIPANQLKLPDQKSEIHQIKTG
jgi:hypothetical protein